MWFNKLSYYLSLRQPNCSKFSTKKHVTWYVVVKGSVLLLLALFKALTVKATSRVINKNASRLPGGFFYATPSYLT